MTVAIVVATAPAREGGPAAALRWDGSTVLARLVQQLASLGVRRVHVLTRPDWRGPIERGLGAVGVGTHAGDGRVPTAAGTAERPVKPTGQPSVRLHCAASPTQDVEVIAGLISGTRASVVVLHGDVVTHREALAGLLADPRVVTGILSGRARRRGVFRTRSARGRVVSAGSPYHAVRRANGSFLGVLKIGARDRDALVDVARQLGRLLAPPAPASWEEELEHKAERWRDRLRRARLDDQLLPAGASRHEERVAASADEHALGPDDVADVADVADPDGADRTYGPGGRPGEELRPLTPAEEAEVWHTADVARQDVVALLLVGLVRGGVHVTNSYLRRLFWARPLAQQAADEAAIRILDFDEDRVLLDSAVKANDGFFTTYFVSPYSKYLARWCARRGLSPNLVTTVSMAIGVLAALSFATGTRPGLIAGAILLQLAFTADCVDGQLARYTRTFSKLGAWLDSVFDRAKEYVVFAGLAYGSVRGFGDDVWVLAAAALTLQTARHLTDFSYAATAHQAMSAAPRLPLEQPSDRTAPLPDLPAPLPTSPEGDVARTAAAVATSPAPSPLLVADPAEPTEPADAVEDRPPVRRRLGAALARQGIVASRALERRPWTRWAKKILVFPIGERFAVISLTAAFGNPRTTFRVVLAWGSVAATYSVTGRVLRSFAR